eukprot:scaffold28750_cov51-Phaeocystis_antarctica.AAC.2
MEQAERQGGRPRPVHRGRQHRELRAAQGRLQVRAAWLVSLRGDVRPGGIALGLQRQPHAHVCHAAREGGQGQGWRGQGQGWQGQVRGSEPPVLTARGVFTAHG